MRLELSEIQQITLRDILTTAGLSARHARVVFSLLAAKRGRVQLAYYYRAQGMTQREVGECIGVSQQAVAKIIGNECKDIESFLRNQVVKV